MSYGLLILQRLKLLFPLNLERQIKKITKATRINSVTKISKGRNSVLKEVPKEKGRVWLTKENKELMCFVFEPNINSLHFSANDRTRKNF